MNRKYTLAIFVMLLTCSMLRAQIDITDTIYYQGMPVGKSHYCFAVEEIEALLHMTFREAYDMLDTKGYQMGFSGDKTGGVYKDTLDGVVLTYSRMTFNDINDRRSALWLYTSQDGLSNIVEWERNRPGECTLFPLFHQRGYAYDRSSATFRGSGVYNGVMENYEVQYFEDSTVMHLTMKNIREIDTFVTHRREAREAELLMRVNEARMMAAADNYLPALALLDSLVGFGARVDSTVAGARRVVLQQAESFYSAMLETMVNNNTDLQMAVKCCDTLLLFTQAKDSIQEIRSVLLKQIDGEIYRYSDLRPEEYREVVSRLEKLINDELSQNVLQEEQRLKLNFTILTRKENESSGKISVGKMIGGLSTNTVGVVGRRLQWSIDDLAHSDLIRPVRQHGVFVTTRNQLLADIRWHSFEMKVQDECNSTNQQMASAVKFIDDQFFTDKDRVRKPTKRNYTFSVNEKRMGEKVYTDIALTKFSTSGALAWVPSLIIPGLGTKNVGLYSSATARVIPFFLFSALSITGFVWENNGGREIERPTFEEGGATLPWHYKDMGYYLGYGAAAVAATIYINDLVEGISYTIRNRHRSKELRKRLKNAPVVVQTELIHLQ